MDLTQIDFSNYWVMLTYAAAGIALAATAGMRAFLPLLVLGIAARVGRFEISEGYHWLASDAALITFAVAVVAETMADKIPLVDHALDTVQTIVKPAVGTMVAAAMFVQLSPFHATLLGLAVGGTVATVPPTAIPSRVAWNGDNCTNIAAARIVPTAGLTIVCTVSSA